ncbi:hypothetical protein [Halostreptopolyspora alba]|uniref:Uncharacterized protein n=1 Tax=Halostreptopolyspora alba TaxID=2487137 RepID=A0A3N0E1G4_9ACTN|nr:hypothetical protein EFW17_21815 [Nocardiopsaceae bacterium YIM 96095]
MAPLVRPARDVAETLLAGAARATGRGPRAEHLSVLDGRTLNLAAVMSRTPVGAPTAVEFASGNSRVNVTAHTVPTVDGHTRVEATVRLRTGEACGRPEPAGHLPEVVLTPGIWGIQLLVGDGDDRGEDGRRVPLAAPSLASVAPRDAPFSVASSLSGTATLAARPPEAAALVRTVLVRPHCARVEGELLGADPGERSVAEVAQCHGEAVHRVRPVLSPGARGTGVTVTLPLPAMAASTVRSEADGSRWVLRFRTADGACLRARREETGPAQRAPVRSPPRTVRPEGGPPVLLRPRHTGSTGLVVDLVVLPEGA